MQEAGVSFLTTWQTFYVLIGSAAAALMGLLFVVITLIAGGGCEPSRKRSPFMQKLAQPSCKVPGSCPSRAAGQKQYGVIVALPHTPEKWF